MGNGHDDERQALANHGDTYTGGWDLDADYPECELWSKYSAFWRKTLYRRVCLESGGDSRPESPAGTEKAGYVPFTPPAQLQPAPVNPIVDTSYALNPVQPWASGFRKPPSGGFKVPAPMLLRPGTGIAGTGGSPAAFQPQAFGEALSLGTGRQSGSSNKVPPDVCYDLVFYVQGSSGKGPAYRGRLVFLVRGTGAVAAYCDVVSGCADPVHYGTPVGSRFKVTGYAGVGDSFHADLDPAFLNDPKTGKRSGAFYIIPLAGGRTCPMGAIGISAGGEELNAIARLLRQSANCGATLRVAYAEKAGGGGDDPAAPQRRGFRLVCGATGKVPSEFCSNQIMDYYLPGISSNEKCNHMKEVWLSSNEHFSYCTSCLPPSGYKVKLMPHISSELASYYDASYIAYPKIPRIIPPVPVVSMARHLSSLPSPTE